MDGQGCCELDLSKLESYPVNTFFIYKTFNLLLFILAVVDFEPKTVTEERDSINPKNEILLFIFSTYFHY